MYKQLQIYGFVAMLLTSLGLQAQEDTSDWQWAKRGGNTSGLIGSEIYSTGMERVLEVVVDSDNNYYFLAEIGSSQADYDDMDLSTYSANGNSKDIYVFSTDCEGNFRWDKMIGGGVGIMPTPLVLMKMIMFMSVEVLLTVMAPPPSSF